MLTWGWVRVFVGHKMEKTGCEIGYTSVVNAH